MKGKLVWSVIWALVGVLVIVVSMYLMGQVDLTPFRLPILFLLGVFVLLGVPLLFLMAKQKVGGMPKKFLLLTGASAVGMPVSALLHNVVGGLFFIEEPIFFIMAVFVCSVGFLVGAVGTIVYALTNKQGKFVTTKKKIIITLVIILVPVAVITLVMLTRSEGHSITTEKDSSFDKKVERIFVIAKVEERLKPVFAHSFEHSMISAFQSNGSLIFSLAPTLPNNLSYISLTYKAGFSISDTGVILEPLLAECQCISQTNNLFLPAYAYAVEH